MTSKKSTMLPPSGNMPLHSEHTQRLHLSVSRDSDSPTACAKALVALSFTCWHRFCPKLLDPSCVHVLVARSCHVWMAAPMASDDWHAWPNQWKNTIACTLSSQMQHGMKRNAVARRQRKPLACHTTTSNDKWRDWPIVAASFPPSSVPPRTWHSTLSRQQLRPQQLSVPPRRRSKQAKSPKASLAYAAHGSIS
eukprot:1286297-Amphidinium_carterae.1